MDATSVLAVTAAALAIVGIVLTMPVGQRIAARLGLPPLRRRGRGRRPASRPRKEDREFLLRVCGGDADEVERRLAAERERFSDLGEADVYRRAIRTYMNARERDA